MLTYLSLCPTPTPRRTLIRSSRRFAQPRTTGLFTYECGLMASRRRIAPYPRIRTRAARRIYVTITRSTTSSTLRRFYPSPAGSDLIREIGTGFAHAFILSHGNSLTLRRALFSTMYYARNSPARDMWLSRLQAVAPGRRTAHINQKGRHTTQPNVVTGR